MKFLSLITFTLFFSAMSFATEEYPVVNNVPTQAGEEGANNGVCKGHSLESLEKPDLPEAVKFVVTNDFPTQREAMDALHHKNIKYGIDDLCLIQIFYDDKVANTPLKPEVAPEPEIDCDLTPTDHYCDGGGVKNGKPGDGQRYLSNYAKTTSTKTVLIAAVNALRAGNTTASVSYGDMNRYFHSITPAKVFEKQIQNTANALNTLMSCTEADPNNCFQSETAESIWLRNNAGSFDNPTQAITKMDTDYDNINTNTFEDKYQSMPGMGAIAKHFTKPAGENTTSIHDQLTSSGGGGPVCDAANLDPTDPNSCNYQGPATGGTNNGGTNN